MDIDLARHLIRTALQTTRELSDLLSLMKRELPDPEYGGFARDVASVIHQVNVTLIDRAIAAQPSLGLDVEASIARYDRYL